jgi:hypothetical protein
MSDPRRDFDLAFEHDFRQDVAPPELWRVCSLRGLPGREPIVHVNWFAAENAARKHGDWINDGRGEVVSITRYVRADGEPQ